MGKGGKWVVGVEMIESVVLGGCGCAGEGVADEERR